MICSFCNLQTKRYLDYQIFQCNNHKLEIIFNNYYKSISFVTDDYFLCVDNISILLYNRRFQIEPMTFPYSYVCPENVELVINKLLKMKPFL